MKILYRLNKPEYLFKPSQLIKRIFKVGIKKTESQMPWGEMLFYNPNDDIGKAINVLGVYELPLTELINRSLKNVDNFLDIGANIGYYSSLAASHSNIKQVQAFEPHPIIFETLSKNCQFSSKVLIHKWAASNSEGEASLYIPKDFDTNMGIATLEKNKDEEIKEIKIQTKTLNSLIDKSKTYCVKIDTEGHEASVLSGASELLSSGAFKYIFFEEFDSYPNAQTFSILENYNYSIFRIERELFGPKLVDPATNQPTKRWQPVNYLAINKELTVIDELKKTGWSILNS